MDVEVIDFTALSFAQLNGTEYVYAQRGNQSFKISLATLQQWAVSGVVFDSPGITLNGGANNGLINNYVDLFTPRVGNKIYKVFVDAAGLVPDGDTAQISVVLTDGNPVNDIELVEPQATASINDQLNAFPIDKTVVPSGFSLKLLVTGATVTAGTIQVTLNYIQS